MDDSIKQTIATLETELRAQQLDHQTRLKEQEDTKTRLERMIQQQGESTKCTLGRSRGEASKRNRPSKTLPRLKSINDKHQRCRKNINSRLERPEFKSMQRERMMAFVETLWLK